MNRCWLLGLIALSTQSLSAEGMREETLKLIAADAQANGKTVPKESGAKGKAKPIEPRSFEQVDPEIVALPRVEVTASRLAGLDQRLERLSREQAREAKYSEPSWLDSIINNPVISILGGGDAESRARRARERVQIMDWEYLLTISLAEPKTPEERARIKADIQMLKDLRR